MDELLTTARSDDTHPPSERVERACITCGADRTGPWCPQCGQRESRGRHTLRNFTAGALRRVAGEVGFIRTARQLAVHPGQVVRDYVAGRTVRYVNPVAYLLLAAALFTLVGRLLVGSTGAADSDRLFTLLVIPLVAVFSRACFWRGPFNYAEHLIAVTYLAAQSLLILTLLYCGTLVVPPSFLGTFAVVCLSVSGAYFVWGYTQVFNRHPWLAAAAAVVSLVLGSIVWFGVVVMMVRLLGR